MTVTVAEARDLAKYIERTKETGAALDGCDLIVWSTK